MTTSLARCDEGEPDATGLLVLDRADPDADSLARLFAALDAHGFRRGHLVGPVLAVTAGRNALEALASYVEAARTGMRPPDADAELFAALAPVDRFAWDEGAEIF